MIDLAKADRNNPLAHLKLGFLSLRLGELGGQAHYDDAASEFQWAIDLQPTWPYAWYGMGLAEYGVGDSQVSFVTGLKTMLGKDALTRSAMAFAKSAEVDPSFVRGLVELSNTALRQRVNIKLGVALDALRRSASTPAGRDPQVLLARGRVEREVGDGDSALAAFHGYLERGSSRSLGQLEIARTLFLLGRFDGVQPYYEGAATDDPATVAGYRADLATIASDSVLNEFDRADRRAARGLSQAVLDRPGPRRAPGRRRTAPRALPPPVLRPQELPAHLAQPPLRLSSSATARAAATSTIAASSTSATASRPAGPPTPRPGLEPNESWRYSRPDGDLIFHFVAREDVQDFKLVESLFDVLGFSQAVVLRGDRASDNPVAEQLMLLARAAVADLPAAAVGRRGSAAASIRRRNGGWGRTSIALGTRTDSYELRLRARSSRCGRDVLAVGRDSSGTQVQIAYAISGKGLEPVTVTRGFLYSVRVRFAAMDATGRVVAVARYHAPLRRARAGARRRAPGRARRRAGARRGSYEYRLAIQQGEEAGVVLPRDTVRVGGPASVGLGAERPRARQPQHQPGLAANRPGHRPVQPAADVQAQRRDAALLRGARGCSPGSRTRCGWRCGSRVAAGACSGRSSAAAARPSASSSTPRPTALRRIGAPRPAARQAEARATTCWR